ncbi:MAG: bifunctional oligoribonuclease/PAP phosphatase NrnA [Bacillota bacterium]|nr:bifunctional oligoribonuclease/PAP phosphatase NrnA [Bacillota bacterium]REJ37450.1 MAG: bifunctional oligoribonuclease/PAP phosphatase NrnA [Bacillota bacterium]
MSPAESLAEVAARLRSHASYVITGHVDPDPDCLGSMLALAWGLERLGKRVHVVSPDPVRPEWGFLPGIESVCVPPPVPDADALVVLDCDLPRTGPAAEAADRFLHIYNLDHHVTNLAGGTVRYIDPTAAATGEIVYTVLVDHWGLALDEAAATNLYTALMTDTGSFRYSNTRAETFRIAAALVDAGARPDEIASRVYERASWSTMRLLARSLATLDRTPDGRVAWITVTGQMLAEAGARYDEADGFVQYPRMIKGVEVALVFRELPDGRTRVGMRSRGLVDVSRVAAELGGGGHPRAAGCTLDLPVERARVRVLEAVARALDGVAVGVPSDRVGGQG